MIRFTYSLNSESAERLLENFQRSLADSSPALKRVADDFREMIAEQFASEGRAGGTPWAELAPATRAAVRRRSGSPLLISTGDLFRSLGEPGAPGHVEELDEQSLTLGSRLPYALFHQTGTGEGRGQASLPPGRAHGRGLPMRPLIVLTEARRQRWLEIIRRHLEGKTLLLKKHELT